jgi:predicted O-methyltransferase YrrM
MSEQTWAAVDQYLADLFVAKDPALAAALADSEKAGLPQMQVSPVQGQLLHLLARTIQAKNILEIGALGGYSTIWLARGLLPGGRLVTLELNPKHAEIAKANVARAGLTNVEFILGPAMESLAKLADQKRGPFDLIFVDADKPPAAEYFNWSLRLSHSGSLIIVDNVIRHGAVIDAASKDAAVQGIRRFNEVLAKEKRAIAAPIQIVGSKGYDGLTIVLVTK